MQMPGRAAGRDEAGFGAGDLGDDAAGAGLQLDDVDAPAHDRGGGLDRLGPGADAAQCGERAGEVDHRLGAEADPDVDTVAFLLLARDRHSISPRSQSRPAAWKLPPIARRPSMRAPAPSHQRHARRHRAPAVGLAGATPSRSAFRIVVGRGAAAGVDVDHCRSLGDPPRSDPFDQSQGDLGVVDRVDDHAVQPGEAVDHIDEGRRQHAIADGGMVIDQRQVSGVKTRGKAQPLGRACGVPFDLRRDLRRPAAICRRP